MPINIFLDRDPKKIKNMGDVESILARIIAFEHQYNCDAGVVVIQRRQFPALYEIVSKEKGESLLKKPVLSDTPEFGILYYPHTYFKALRDKLEGNINIKLPEPITWERYRRGSNLCATK